MFGNPMNPANPANLINPISPWCAVCDPPPEEESTQAVVVQPEKPVEAPQSGFDGVSAVGVVVMVFLLLYALLMAWAAR